MMNDDEDRWPRNVMLAANTIGYTLQLQGVELDREQAITVAARLAERGQLA